MEGFILIEFDKQYRFGVVTLHLYALIVQAAGIQRAYKIRNRLTLDADIGCQYVVANLKWVDVINVMYSYIEVKSTVIVTGNTSMPRHWRICGLPTLALTTSVMTIIKRYSYWQTCLSEKKRTENKIEQQQ